MWLFSESDDDAIDHAEAILSRLPYEGVGEGVTIRHCDKLESNAAWRRCEEAARELGFSLWLAPVATGADEAEFEAMDPP